MAHKSGSEWKGWVRTIAGSMMVALAFNIFLVPNQIAPGGLSGLAQLVNALTGWPIGLVIAALNIPLLAVAWRLRGKVFILRTLLSVALLSLLIDTLKMPEAVTGLLQGELLLSTVFGGLISGLGMGLVITGDSSTGGTDLVAIIIHKRLPHIRIASLLMAVDALVVLGAVFVFDLERALYALICVFITSRCMDFVETGMTSAKAFFIISKQQEAITRRLVNEMERGVTLLSARGAYHNDDKNVIFCVVARQQIQPVKRLVKQEDPGAFVVISDVKEALGEGFRAF